MSKLSHNEKPLSPGEFYLLFALSMKEGYAYSLRGRIANLSQGSVDMTSGTLLPLLKRMHDLGFIDLTGMKAAGKSGIPRRHYGLSDYGVIRVKEELVRLRHAVRTADNAGLFDDEMPLEIQKLMLDAR